MTRPFYRSPVVWWSLCLACALFGAWAFFNMAAGASLACVPCNCTYALTAADARCQGPAIWALGFYVGVAGFLLSGGLAVWSHVRNARQHLPNETAHT